MVYISSGETREYNRSPAGKGKEKKMEKGYSLYEVTFRTESGAECVRQIVATGLSSAITESCHEFYMSCGLMSLDYTPVKAEEVTL